MLTDKLAKSMEGSTEAERQRADKLAQTIVFTSQGTPFMFAGEEIFRDKKGVHNSYKSPDSINAIDWELKAKNADIYNYYRQLIALRKGHPAFRMTSAEDVAKHLVFDNVNESGLVSYSLKDNANGDSWKEIKVIFNGSNEAKTVKVPSGKWLIVAQDGQLNAEGMGYTKGGKLEVAPCSALILAKEK
jgi:pullulanase